jgi:hypothetical protein
LRATIGGLVLFQFVGLSRIAWADDLWFRTFGRQVVATRARPVYAQSATLGTFMPTPYMVVRSNNPLGGGYSPLDIYGDQTLTLYGPISSLRPRTAPIRNYVRGYDGRLYISEGNSFSNPNTPELAPVIYPTEANNFFGPRVSRTPQWWSSAINWIDQN